MGFLPGFEEDVFISYAHNDDDHIATEPRGWVAQLHDDLRSRVKVYLGAEARLWRDCEIRNNEDFANKILRRLVKTATLLSVISPSFFQRTWCLRELEEFARHAEDRFGIRIDEEKFRIFKVEKLPVDRDRLPLQLQGSVGYKFYGSDPEHEGEVHEYRPMLGEAYLRSYFREMDQLAKDIAAVLKEMAAQGADMPAASSRPVVYLAEPTSDLHDEANEIRRDLQERGFVVLPPGDLPYRMPDLMAKVRGWLKRSVLSVHLIGQEYGFIPEGEVEKSSAWLQHDLAMERGADPSFARLIWMRNGTKPSDARQQRFIEYLQEDPAAQRGADMLETKIEDLKAALQEKLREIRDSQEKQPTPGGTPKESVGRAPDEPLRIYLICDRLDLDSKPLLALKKLLFDQGFEPMLPSECEDEGGALQAHIENLGLCDACLIYYGKGSEKWFEAKLMDFRKILSRRQPRILAKAIYLAPPESVSKSELQTHEAVVLRGAEPFSPDALAPFVNQIRNAAGAARA